MILVAGASGLLGRAVTRALRARGHRVRAMARTAETAAALHDLADEVVLGDALVASSLAEPFSKVRAVVSCVGASVSMHLKGRASYLDVDVPANANLIEAASRHSVERFVYISAHAAQGYDSTRYVQAHRAVEGALYRAVRGQAHFTAGIIQPTGLFPAFDDFLDMARRGIASMPGDGSARANPIHPDDVADAVVRALDDPRITVQPVGGPDVFTRRHIVELAFQVQNRRPRIIAVPAGVFAAAGAGLRPVHPRLGDLVDFAARVFTHDSIAPCVGQRRLVDYFRERVA